MAAAAASGAAAGRPAAAAVGLLLLGALLLRLLSGYGSYSGEATPPKYGDYEAQRHWMEVTINTSVDQWYTDTPDNNPSYWPLDYPPVTGYQSWLHGQFMRFLDPPSVELTSSRGHETYTSKYLLRWTVVLSDLLVFFPAAGCAVYVFSSHGSSSKRQQAILFGLAVALLQPALLLIDHLHFQYNCISLGFCALAAAAIAADYQILGSIAFCLALNHKQMSLFYAPAFFGHLLGRCLQQPTWPRKIWGVARLGLTVVATFAICWSPYLTSLESILQVLHRIFPVRRGLYEDYLSNFWCTTSVALKWKRLFDNPTLMKLCASITLLAASPSMVQQMLEPSPEGLLLAMANSAYAFFMFSYQVHEKSILLPLLPITLLAAQDPESAVWAPVVAAFQMYPLLERDGAALVYFAGSFIYLLVVSSLQPGGGKQGSKQQQQGLGALLRRYRSLLIAAGLLASLALHALRLLPAPESLPWLWDRLHVTAAFVPVAAHMVYTNYWQWAAAGAASARGGKKQA